MIETLRPTANQIVGAVTNPTMAYDGDENTRALLAPPTAGSVARLLLSGFPDGTIPVGERVNVTLRARGVWGDAGASDRTTLFYRENDLANSEVLSHSGKPGPWGDWVEFDITSLIGTTPVSESRVEFVTGNAPTDPSTPPTPTA